MWKLQQKTIKNVCQLRWGENFAKKLTVTLPVKIVGPPTKIVLKTWSSLKTAISVKN